MRPQPPFRGIIAAPVAPMRDDFSLDEEDLAQHAYRVAKHLGITGLLCNGHTGEILSLTREERARVIQVTRRAVGPAVTILAGVHGQSVAESVMAINDAERAGANAAVIFTPFSFGRGAFQYPDIVIGYYNDLASQTNLNLLFMQYPPHGGLMMPSDLVVQVARLPRVIGMKQAVGEVGVFEAEYRALCTIEKPFSYLTASEGALFTSFLIGCDGALIGFANIPEPIVTLWDAVQSGDLNRARAANDAFYDLSRAIYGMPSFRWSARLKYALFKLGRIQSPAIRPPLQRVTDAEASRIDAALAKLALPAVERV
jgi:4-hydroxy-tetrahydrodipicolinate synthase